MGPMEINEAVVKLRQFIIDHDLPKTDMALFGIKCPYCGKSDRIRELDEPEQVREGMDSEDIKIYSDLWMMLARPGRSLGVCKFCHNPLRISGIDGTAETLIAEDEP